MDDDSWARATVYPFDGSDLAMKPLISSSHNDVETVEGVIEVKEEVIGRTEWHIEVDVVAGKIVSVSSKDIRDGVGESEKMMQHKA